MTPGERQYDIDLANNMRLAAEQFVSRSRRLHDLLTEGAKRLDALSGAMPITTPENTPDTQPASTPEQQPVMGHGKDKRLRRKRTR